jgi:MHS family alpha-ketoglutarate permease-like MFS transporter
MSQVSDPTSTERHQLPVRTLVAASIGNAIEWFD